MLVNKIIDMHFDENKKYRDWLGKPLEFNDNLISLKKEEKIVLYYIFKYGESSMGEITSSFDFAHSTTNYIIKNLESKELVSIKQSEKDNRIRLINLTQKGENTVILLMDYLEKITFSIISDLLPIVCENFENNLTKEENLLLEKILSKI